jgi:hypothetical protein
MKAFRSLEEPKLRKSVAALVCSVVKNQEVPLE